MSARIDLVWLGPQETAPDWVVGQVWPVEPSPPAVQRLIEEQAGSAAAGLWLFWHAALGAPDPDTIARVAALPGEAWHAGLRLGLGGLPGLIDFVTPTWMLNRDPDPALEATSWRLSLHACLIAPAALRQLGGVDPGFTTLEAAALELGHRAIMCGLLLRHVPWMVARAPLAGPVVLPLQDELRFVRRRFGRLWSGWALARAVITGYASPWAALRAWRQTAGADRFEPPPYERPHPPAPAPPAQARVSVLIPTVDRYAYLRTLLGQLRAQSVPPYEIIVVDQTAEARRDSALAADFGDLPLRVVTQDAPGQCASRNAGLKLAGGEYILFVDDDDELPPDLIETHLANLRRFSAEVSSGVADEVGAGPVPAHFRLRRASDVFPTNNTLIRRGVLRRSGLFDMAYDRRKRADGDLGTRLYLSGTLMVFDPRAAVLHHHAPQGGLRVHRERVVTYASSRSHLMQRHLPGASEIYLDIRYFTPRQVREALWLRALGTFSLRGGVGRRLLKAAVALVLLPHTWRVIRQQEREALRMLEVFPQIPALVGPEQPG